MNQRITVPLGPLVDLSALEFALGTGTLEGDVRFWDCGCAARYDRYEGAWRYASVCTDHEVGAA